MSRRTALMKAARMNLCGWNIAVYQQPPYTCVDCGTLLSGYAVRGIGFAKCNRTDKWDAERGKQIALGRALRDAVNQYMAANP